MFLIADRNEDRGLKQTQLINFALIKMGAAGMYGKALERWAARDIPDRRNWATFRQIMVEQY